MYTYTYDPASRLSKVVKKAARNGKVLETESYTHDANANVISQTVAGKTTAFTYDRNRLVSSSANGATATYNYDPFGRLNTVTSAGKIIESYRYDGFSRTIEHSKRTDGSLSTTTYAYDPLDRTVSKTADGKTREFDYLGLSNKVVSEEIAGQLKRTYTYSAWGRRLSQVKHDAAGGPEISFYGYNAHSPSCSLTLGG